MDTSTTYDAEVYVKFTDSFPKAGEEREIVKKDGTEWMIHVIEVSNPQWEMENGQVIGVNVDMKYHFIEEVRPSSKGKLRLI